MCSRVLPGRLCHGERSPAEAWLCRVSVPALLASAQGLGSFPGTTETHGSLFLGSADVCARGRHGFSSDLPLPSNSVPAVGSLDCGCRYSPGVSGVTPRALSGCATCRHAEHQAPVFLFHRREREARSDRKFSTLFSEWGGRNSDSGRPVSKTRAPQIQAVGSACRPGRYGTQRGRAPVLSASVMPLGQLSRFSGPHVLQS